MDALAIPIPEARVKVFEALKEFEQAKTLFEQLASVLDRIAKGPAGEA
jgi:hypothetical protein